MKDLPHHIKKLNRRVIRSMRREEMEALPEIPTQTPTERELKRQAKQKMRDERLSHVSSDLTPDQRNKKMRARVPIFDRNNAEPKHTRSSKKKSPRI